MEIEEINTHQGGGLGSAILAAVGAGFYKTVDEGCQKLIKVVNKINPIEEDAEYLNQLYPKYQAGYQALKEWFETSR
jgi:xylulokinase